MVRSLSARKNLVSLLFACLGLLSAQPAGAAAPLKVEALGFFSHPPMWETRDTIQQVCQEFGDRVELVMHDEMTSDGQGFMQSNGLSGHIPMVLYLDGSPAHQIDGRTVEFRDFVNMGWKAGDLEQVIKLNLAGEKTAVKEPADVSAQAGNPQSYPMQSSPGYTTTPAGSPWASRSNLLFAGLGLVIVVLLVAFLLSRRRAPKGK